MTYLADNLAGSDLFTLADLQRTGPDVSHGRIDISACHFHDHMVACKRNETIPLR